MIRLEKVLGVTPRVEKMVKNILMWFEHVERRYVDFFGMEKRSNEEKSKI